MAGRGQVIRNDMKRASAVWHFGLMAEYWALFKREAPELPGLLALVARFGQPVLDLGCGSGRVLTQLLKHGVDADGVDVSEDMLAHARAAAEQAGYAPSLLVQTMSDLAPPRRYQTILIVDSFGLGGDRGLDLAILRQCYAALLPGGALVLNIGVEYETAADWGIWTTEGRRHLPQAWPDEAVERVAPNGDLFRLRIRALSASPLRQTYAREMEISKWVDGALAASESAALEGNMYLPSEVDLMLRTAEFADVEMFDGFSQTPATDASGQVVIVAQRALPTR